MLTVISLMLGGMLAGFLLRKRRRIPMQRLITSLVWLLLFLLGVEAGSNSDVVRGLHTLGAEALLMAVCTTGGSVAAARLLWDITRRKRRKDGSQHLPEADAPAQGEHALRGSFVIIAFFVAGTVCGLLHLLPFDVAESRVSFYALCVLMACVGISVGNNPTLAASCRGLSPWYALLPVATIVGTMAGSLLAFLLLPGRSAADCLAVGSGFGAPSPCWPISCAKSSRCWPHRCWHAGADDSPPLRQGEQQQWIPRFPSLPRHRGKRSSWYPYSTGS